MSRLAALLILLSVSGCGVGTDVYDAFGVPERTRSPDLSGVTAEFRETGGQAFIKITAPATRAVLKDLEEQGVTDLKNYPLIETVSGIVPAGGVEAVAARPYVVSIESASLGGVPAPQED